MRPNTCIGCGRVCEADCIDNEGKAYKGCGYGCRILTLAEIGAKATAPTQGVHDPQGESVQRLRRAARAIANLQPASCSKDRIEASWWAEFYRAINALDAEEIDATTEVSELQTTIPNLDGSPSSLRAGTSDPLHPYGRCTCAGEGRCEWCKRTLVDEARDGVSAPALDYPPPVVELIAAAKNVREVGQRPRSWANLRAQDEAVMRLMKATDGVTDAAPASDSVTTPEKKT